MIEELAVVRHDPELEVAAPTALGAEPCAGPVRAAEVEQLTIDDHGLHVNARAAAQGEPTIQQARMIRDLFAERPGRNLGVKQPQLDAASGELVET